MGEVLVEDFEDIFVISLSGGFIFNHTKNAEIIFKDVIKKRPKTIGVDCGELKTLDSSGLGIFIRFSKLADSANIELLFLDISEQILKLFDLSKLSYMFDIMTRKEFDNLYL